LSWVEEELNQKREGVQEKEGDVEEEEKVFDTNNSGRPVLDSG